MKTVSTTNAPAAIGPYSQAQIVGSMVYTSGQVGIDPDPVLYLKVSRLRRIRCSKTSRSCSRQPAATCLRS